MVVQLLLSSTSYLQLIRAGRFGLDTTTDIRSSQGIVRRTFLLLLAAPHHARLEHA